MPKHSPNSVKWLPYIVGAAIHAALGAVGYVLLMAFAMGAADSGVLEAPIWLKGFAIAVAVMMLPIAWLIAQFAPVNWPTTHGLFVLFGVCLCNSALLAALVRRVRLWVPKPQCESGSGSGK